MTFHLLHRPTGGIGTHGQEFKFYTSYMNPCPRIIRWQETFLKPYLSFTYPGYFISRTDRAARDKGGLAMLIKHGIFILLCAEILMPTVRFEVVRQPSVMGKPSLILSMTTTYGHSYRPALRQCISPWVHVLFTRHKSVIRVVSWYYFSHLC